MQLSTICIINASGTFLSKHLTQDLIEGDEQRLYQFIAEHQWIVVEDYEPEDVLKMILDLAQDQQSLIENHAFRVIKDRFFNFFSFTR